MIGAGGLALSSLTQRPPSPGARQPPGLLFSPRSVGLVIRNAQKKTQSRNERKARRAPGQVGSDFALGLYAAKFLAAYGMSAPTKETRSKICRMPSFGTPRQSIDVNFTNQVLATF